jgi:hypothetical protein
MALAASKFRAISPQGRGGLLPLGVLTRKESAKTLDIWNKEDSLGASPRDARDSVNGSQIWRS